MTRNHTSTSRYAVIWSSPSGQTTKIASYHRFRAVAAFTAWCDLHTLGQRAWVSVL